MTNLVDSDTENKKLQRIADKCIQLFTRRIEMRRGAPQKTVCKFLDRLFPDNSGLSQSIFEDRVIPIVREHHYKGMALEEFVENALIRYRSSKYSRFSALTDIWSWLDNELPLTMDEYSQFVEMLESALEREPNPPTKDDWEDLNEWLMK